MIARIVVPCLAACLLSILCVSVARSQEQTSVTLENEFIRLVVNKGPDEAGRFSVKTTGGDPALAASKNQHLIFGESAPWTSYTTLLIDGKKYGFGGSTRRPAGMSAQYGKLVSAPSISDGLATTVTIYDDIEVVQELSIVRGMSTRMLDTVGITYRVTNRGSAPHTVGLRVLLDTMCGSNDGAPIRAGNQAIMLATSVNGADIPDFWQAFDSLSDPTVVSQGTLRGGHTTPPDRVMFADWGSFADESWEPSLAPDQGFIRKGEDDPDTATALFWNPETIEPGQTKTYVTYYGLGYVKTTPGQLTLGMTAPAETTFEHERTQAFTIAGYLQNAGGFDGRNVTLTLKLPSGLTLVGGDKLKQTIANLKTGDTAQGSWTVRPNGKTSGKQQLILEVTSDNIESNTLALDIQVNVPAPTVQVTPSAQRVPLMTNARPTRIPINVNLSPADEFHGIRFVLRYDPQVLSPLFISRGLAFVDEGRLLAGWEFDDSVDGRIRVTGRRVNANSLTQAELNLVNINFRTVAAGATGLQIEEAVLISESGEEHPVKVTSGSIEIVDGPVR